MIYNITQNFQRLGITSGTVQNTHASYTIELSDNATADSGIILYPRQKFSFSGTTLYARCKGAGGAELRAVSFFAGDGGGSGSVIDDSNVATDDELNNLMDDIFG